MLGLVYVSAFHRVLMDIFELFPHHRFADDHFNMGTFLPELIFAVVLVRLFGESQAKPPSQTWRTFLQNHMHNNSSKRVQVRFYSDQETVYVAE